MDLKSYFRNWLNVASKNELKDLRADIKDLQELKGTLTDSVLEDKPQMRFILKRVENEALTRKQIATELKEKFDISRATAYRRINELERDYQLIRETEKDLIKAISFSSHETQFNEK
jgi:hypothetical protein